MKLSKNKWRRVLECFDTWCGVFGEEYDTRLEISVRYDRLQLSAARNDRGIYRHWCIQLRNLDFDARDHDKYDQLMSIVKMEAEHILNLSNNVDTARSI